MILKLTNSAWQNHPHPHDPKRRCLKLEGWGRRLKNHSVEFGEQTIAANEDEYSFQVWQLFNGAARRCPSISVDADIMEGQPCIAGTRIPVRSVLRAVEHYGSIDGARECYPHLTADQVQDALFFSQVILELPLGIDEAPLTPR